MGDRHSLTRGRSTIESASTFSRSFSLMMQTGTVPQVARRRIEHAMEISTVRIFQLRTRIASHLVYADANRDRNGDTRVTTPSRDCPPLRLINSCAAFRIWPVPWIAVWQSHRAMQMRASRAPWLIWKPAGIRNQHMTLSSRLSPRIQARSTRWRTTVPVADFPGAHAPRVFISAPRRNCLWIRNSGRRGADQCTRGACAPQSGAAFAAVDYVRDYDWFSLARISGSRTSAHSPVSSSAFTFLPESARSRMASVSSYSPRGDGCNLAVNSKMLGRKA
jgi:hypothetical protein